MDSPWADLLVIHYLMWCMYAVYVQTELKHIITHLFSKYSQKTAHSMSFVSFKS